jgi:hypothetical protein
MDVREDEHTSLHVSDMQKDKGGYLDCKIDTEANALVQECVIMRGQPMEPVTNTI